MTIPRSIAIVLVVDDDAKVGAIMSRLLERAGYEVITALDGDGALEVAQHRSVGAVILDWRLPSGLAGSELVAQLRRRCGEKTPVLVVSGDWAAFTEADRALASD